MQEYHKISRANELDPRLDSIMDQELEEELIPEKENVRGRTTFAPSLLQDEPPAKKKYVKGPKTMMPPIRSSNYGDN